MSKWKVKLGIGICLLLVICGNAMPFFAESTLQSIDDSAVEEATGAGTYPVVATYQDENGNEVTKTFYVTLRYPRTVVVEEYGEAIDAIDFQIEKGQFAMLDSQALIKLAKAHAWNTRTGNAVQIVDVMVETVDQDLGIHKVIFTTANGTRTTANVHEVENMLIGFSQDEYYFDYNFRITLWYLGITTVLMLLAVVFLFGLNYWKTERTIKKANKILYKYEIKNK